MVQEVIHALKLGKTLTKTQILWDVRIQLSENHLKSNKCRNVFYQSWNLTVYKSVHIGDKAYRCSEYGKVFNQSSKLTQHQRIERSITSAINVGRALSSH